MHDPRSRRLVFDAADSVRLLRLHDLQNDDILVATIVVRKIGLYLVPWLQLAVAHVRLHDPRRAAVVKVDERLVCVFFDERG